MLVDYGIALAETEEIISKMEEGYINKIPMEIIEYIKKYKNPNWTFKYNPEKDLEEQNIHIETIEILSYLNLNYWASEEEKNYLTKLYKRNYTKHQLELKAKYSTDALFLNKQKTKKDEQLEKQEVNLQVIEESSIFSKIIKKIKKIFKR